jgi:integrase
MSKPFRVKNRKTGEFPYGGQWCIKYRTPDGTWRRQVAGATKKEASKTLCGVLTDIERNVWIDPRHTKREAKRSSNGPQTWGEILILFKRAKYTLPEQKNSRACLKYTVLMLEEGVNDSGPLLPEKTPINQLDKRTLRFVYDAIGSSKLSTRTKNLRLTYIRIVFRWAIKHPAIAIDADPTDGLERFKNAGSRAKCTDGKAVEPDEVFSLSEVQKMLAYAKANIGDANATLKKWKARSPYSRNNDLVFPRSDGQMRAEDYHWAYVVKRVAEKTGVLRPELSRFGHLTRHTFATLYLRAGGSDILLAKILGHADTRLVHQVYSHFCAEDLRADMSRGGFSLSQSVQ